MRLPDNILQKVKIALHGIQGFVIFLAWAITIAIFTKPGSTDGRTKFFFALCWFSIPLLVYQAAVPQFARTKRFSNAYAHAVIDALLALFWFAAFISVATWTNAGIKKGVGRPGTKGCDAFAWGDGKSRGSKCRLSQVTIGMGVVLFLLSLCATFISVKNLLYYRRNGSMPGITPAHTAHPLPNHDEDDQTKYAFSSNPHDHLDEDEEAAQGGSNYEVLHPSADDHDTTLHPGGSHQPWGSSNNPSTTNLGRYDDPDRIDTSYHGTTASTLPPPQLPPHRDPFRDRSPSPYRVHNPPPAEVEGEDTGYRGRYDPSPHRKPAAVGEAGDPFGDDAGLGNDHGGGGRVDFPSGNYR